MKENRRSVTVLSPQRDTRRALVSADKAELEVLTG
jgi:hypothetical protein